MLAALGVGPALALPLPVREALARVGLPETALAVWVAPVSRGAPVLSVQAEAAFAPASTIKTLTTIVALETLGPNWRGQTRLLTRAPVRMNEAGVATLGGDVILRGEANVDFDEAALDQLFARLRARGVARIAGDLLVDRSFFRPARTDRGLPPFDAWPEFRYNAIPDALFLSGHLFALEIGTFEGNVRIMPRPVLPCVRWQSAAQLTEEPCAAWEQGWRPPQVEATNDGAIVVTLQGRLPRECLISTAIQVIDRDEFVARLVRARWEAAGGRLDGQVRFVDEGSASADDLQELAQVRSRTLAEIARDIQRRSDNPVTRMIYLALGAREARPEETTAQAAERVVRRWLAERGIDATGLVLENGSGLSRRERIAPRTLGEVLRAARRSPWWPEFAYGLPVAGRDGSLARRLADSAAARLPTPARLKTGTLRDVGALAGYITASDGVEYVFVAMVNHPEATTARAQPVLDALVDWVARAGWRTEPWVP
ncbi:MAG: D-alanyl-D-alanine carboxypeptidase/D-alanyl-D-alanine-endopeptidase [Casimicrobiaceae bacterium]|nr:D-alanyl-D-alanine carboxypeptidase/D-alanyl-D-alanine-endopeptidase [Casimicrobiaceae bacterium]